MVAYWSRIDGGQATFHPTYTTPGRAVLMTGQAGNEWTGIGSQLPRALINEGGVVIAAAGTTVAAIDLLAAAADVYTDIDTVCLVASEGACQAALEWVVTRTSQVASLALLAPSGVTLTDPRRVAIRDMLEGAGSSPRVQVWHVAGDSTAAALAADLGATVGILDNADPTLATATGIAAMLVEADSGWMQEAAAVEKRRWIEFVESHPSTVGWHKWGDGHQALELASGDVWHFFADTGDGTIDSALGVATSGSLVRNSIVRRTASGSFSGQIWNGSFSGPSHTEAIIPNQGTFPGHFWWPIEGAALNQSGNPVVICGRLSGVADYQGADLVRMNPTTGAVTNVTSVPVGSVPEWRPFDLATHGGYHYIYKETPTSDGISVSRCTLADLETPANWRHWDSEGWSTVLNDHAPMHTTAGDPLPAFLVDWAVRSSRYGFLAVAKSVFDRDLHVYRSGWPQGPWEPVAVLSVGIDIDGARVGGDQTWSYIPAWHPQLDTDTGLMVSYATGYASQPNPMSDLDYWYAVTQFAVIPRTLIT